MRGFPAFHYCLVVLLFLTFTCYGTHLPGDPRGSFDHVRQGDHRFIPPSADLQKYHRSHLRQEPYLLSTPQARTVVRDAILDVCRFRGWSLCALHVRTNHVHGLVDADVQAGNVFNAWKAYSTRALRAAEHAASDRLVWAHGGSAHRIESRFGLARAIRYLLEGQGEPMATYCSEDLERPALSVSSGFVGEAE